MIRWTALALTTLTGFSGLAYEVAWEKYLATLLGSHAEATAAVLGLFLGGLSAGYVLFGRVTRGLVERARTTGRPAPLLTVYGAIEASIGVWVLLFPLLFDGVQAVSGWIPGGGAFGFGVDVALSALLVGPPAVLMGGTIPFLTQALPRNLEDATRTHALVYGFNTAGAFAGALGAGFVLIPWLGLARVMVVMGFCNLAAGAVFVLLGRSAGAPVTGATAETESPIEGFAGYAGVALLVGFAMMAIQAVLIRVGGLALGSSPFTFSMVVAVFVACIAIGSLAVSMLPRIPELALPVTLWSLLLLLYLLYGTVENAPYWAHRIRIAFPSDDASFHSYYASAFGWTLAAFGPPVILSGASLPLLFHHLRDRVGDLGAVAGRLYGWNTVGSLLGALLGGYALLFVLDLHHVYRIALASLAVAVVWATVRLFDVSRAVGVGVLLLPTLVALAMLPAWRPERLASGLFRIREGVEASRAGADALFEVRKLSLGEVLFHDDDPTASVTVVEVPTGKGRGSERALISNGKSEGSTGADSVTIGLTALLPSLFAENVERGFVIGYGTGGTAAALAALDSIEFVDVAEISPAVIRAAPLFDFANRGASRDPRIRIWRSDAYRALRRSPVQYDVIASEPSNPWVAGVELLYSLEFLEAAKDRLRPGGVFAQWFHLYETDGATVELILRTYTQVFDDVSVWFTLGHDLVILGFQDASNALDLDRVAERAARPDFARALLQARVQSLPALLAHELWPVGVARAALADGPVHTVHRPRLAYVAGRAFFRGDDARLPFSGFGAAATIGRENSLLRRLGDRSGGRLSESDRARAVSEVCTYRAPECVAMLSRWIAESPDSPELERAIAVASRRRSQFGAPWEAATLRPIAALHRAAAQSAVTPESAARFTRDYARFYHHPVPFDPNALVALSRSCRGAERSCADEEEAVRRLLVDGARTAGPGLSLPEER